MAAPDLIASFFTLAGRLLPSDQPLVSPVPLVERVDAAARAGFAGMGFNFDDAAAARERHGDAGLRRLLADAGMRWIELEALIDWFADGDRRAASDAQRRIAIDQARAMGAYHLKVAGDLTGDWPLDAMAEAFAALCDAVADDGIRVTIELLPFGNLGSLDRGLAVVQGAGRANGGLLLDAWHVRRCAMALEDIAALPPGICQAVELDDGPADPVLDDPYVETIRHRLLPGDGDFDLEGLIHATRAAGFHGPYGVEILSDAQRAMTPAEAARRTFDKSIAVLERAGPGGNE